MCFLQRNRNAPYFVCALDFVRWLTISGAKSGLSDDFPQKFFPITPPGNGNETRSPRALWECSLKLATVRRCQNNFRLNLRKKYFFGTRVFATFKAKNAISCSRIFLSILKDFVFWHKAVRYTLCAHCTFTWHLNINYRFYHLKTT